MNMWRNRGLAISLLAIYLILVGLQSLFGLSFQGMDIILGLLALVAGLLLLLNRW